MAYIPVEISQVSLETIFPASVLTGVKPFQPIIWLILTKTKHELEPRTTQKPRQHAWKLLHNWVWKSWQVWSQSHANYIHVWSDCRKEVMCQCIKENCLKMDIALIASS